MNTIEKTFVVPQSWLQRRGHLLHAAIGQLNSRKHGRLRRGCAMLVAASCGVDEAGRYTVTLNIAIRKQHSVIVRDGGSAIRKYAIYSYCDIAKLIKSLVVAQRKALA